MYDHKKLHLFNKKQLIQVLHASCGFMRGLRTSGLSVGDPRYNDSSVFNMEDITAYENPTKSKEIG